MRIQTLVAFVGLTISWSYSRSLDFPEEGKIFSVCELLASLDRLRDSFVEVRAVLDGNPYHGTYGLYDYDQHYGDCGQLLEAGKQWPSELYFEWPDSEDGEDEDRKNVFDLLHENPEQVIVGNFTGRLRVKWFSFIRKRGDLYGGFGYGPGGKYPAKLIISRVNDVLLIDRNEWIPPAELHRLFPFLNAPE